MILSQINKRHDNHREQKTKQWGSNYQEMHSLYNKQQQQYPYSAKMVMVLYRKAQETLRKSNKNM